MSFSNYISHLFHFRFGIKFMTKFRPLFKVLDPLSTQEFTKNKQHDCEVKTEDYDHRKQTVHATFHFKIN